MANDKKITVKFLQDYTPRKKGEVVALDVKLAKWYMNAQVAVECKDCKEEKPCTDCDKAKDPVYSFTDEDEVEVKLLKKYEGIKKGETTTVFGSTAKELIKTGVAELIEV